MSHITKQIRQVMKPIRHWKKLHLKVSQGLAQMACMIFFCNLSKKLTKALSIIISMNVASITDFQAISVTLFKGKVRKITKKHLIDFGPTSIQLLFVNFFKRPVEFIISSEEKLTLIFRLKVPSLQMSLMIFCQCLPHVAQE